MNNNNNNRFDVTAVQARDFIRTFEGVESPQELAALFDNMRDALGMRASARFKDGVAGVMALGRYRTGDSGHIWVAAQWRGSIFVRDIRLDAPKLKVLFDNMSKATMGACLVAIVKYHTAFDYGLVKELIENRGVSPNAADFTKEKRTALHYATDPAKIRYLISKGANPNARDAAGQTPLHMCLPMPATLKARLAAGADPNARDAEGRTPLFMHGSPDIIKMLIRAGADPSIKNKKGDTALRFLLKHFESIGKRGVIPWEDFEAMKILMDATDAKPSNIGNIKIANLPKFVKNIQNAVATRASLGVRRFGTAKKALNERLNSNTTNIIMRQAFG